MDYSKIEREPYLTTIQQTIAENGWTDLQVGKVITVHRDGYLVLDESGEYKSQLLGHLLYQANTEGALLPVTGDWVTFQAYDDLGIIHGVLPRKMFLSRDSGKVAQVKQAIVANADSGLIVMGADRDFNLNRVERFMALCYAGELEPIIVVTKVDDLGQEAYNQLRDSLKRRFENVPYFFIDSVTGRGLGELKKVLKAHQTFALMGSSGAGKSTLLNALAAQEKMETGQISEHVNKGKHTTTHRELVTLPNGAFIIDNPGLRAVGVSTAGEGLGQTFASIDELAATCRFGDCTHVSEPGCKVLEALEAGVISQEAYDNFHKMVREAEHYESTEYERRKKQKSFAAMVKKHKKDYK